ncbi:single strand DNA binding protein [Arthrobacter phage Tank]|uniref:SsDNA binding protein n=1 Tax=Arthrobacter phage Tank TaxID=1772319 RepID=A0A0U4IQ14_9CAUD|nr:single strand DNA binding protein [Arthrobacter phage Tank]ALY10607.1 ssDNA binding protein [Arthrobacter phage Tank]
MAGETTITVIGNLTNDPELRFTPSGDAVANFTIASTPRTFDRQSNEWKDGETLFLRSSVWREAAENVAESLTKGMRVIASGVLKSRSYEKNGEKRTVTELEIVEIGPSLKYANAKVNRTQRSGNNQGGGNNRGGNQGNYQNGNQQGGQQGGGNYQGGNQQGGNYQGNQQGGQQGGNYQQQDDPWATPQGGNQGGGWGNGPDSEPPF